MKRYKVKEVIELLEADGWVKVKTKGDQKVTVRGHLNETVSQELLNSMWKQAGWK